MSESEAVTVVSVAELRQQISKILSRFGKEGVDADPVVIGSQRRPEAVLVSYAQYRAMADDLLELIRARAWIARARADAEALASVRAEGLEPDAFGHSVARRVVEGEISDDEAIAELDRHFGHPRATG
ncbi:MAG: antitoxin VbhA family protein [Candidatus Dormibacteria bacterium]